MESFKNRIKEVRLNCGLSQQELADMIHVSKQSISQYERGVRKPDMNTLTALGDVLNVSIDYLTGKSDVTLRLLNSEELKKVSEAGSYYNDPAAADLAEFLHQNPDYKVLFDASRKVKPEDIEFVRQMIDRMSGQE